MFIKAGKANKNAYNKAAQGCLFNNKEKDAAWTAPFSLLFVIERFIAVDRFGSQIDAEHTEHFLINV